MRLQHPEGNMRAHKTERFQVLMLRFQYAVLTDNDMMMRLKNIHSACLILYIQYELSAPDVASSVGVQ